MSRIEIKGLTKIYGDTVALDNVDLSLEGETIYGLLGRNGAGKTTLLNLLTVKTHPTTGRVTIDGEPVWENDSALGNVLYMTEPNLYPQSLRVRDVLKWTAEFTLTLMSIMPTSWLSALDSTPKEGEGTLHGLRFHL